MTTEITTATELDDLNVRIPFGDRANESVPPSWAERMLRLLRQRDPSLFVVLMGEAATGYRAEMKQRRGQNGSS